MFEFFSSKPKAVIVKADLATGEVEVSQEIPSIQQANAIQAATIAASHGAPIDRDLNDFDGHVTTALIPQDEQQTVYHRTIFESIPISEL
jgi:hypothetical protein